jgi:hypothetical protein
MTSFAALVAEYLKHHSNVEMARTLGIIPSTVNRWALGLATPLQGMQKMVVARISKMREAEGW